MSARESSETKVCGTVTLADALDRILERGVSLQGNVVIGLADVDLLYLDLRLLLGSVDTIWPDGPAPLAPIRPQVPDHSSSPVPAPTPTLDPRDDAFDADIAPATGTGPVVVSEEAPPPSKSSSTAQGLVRLVLTLVKLLHDTLERQAVRRMEEGRLDDAQIDRLGSALFAQAEQILLLQRKFGFTDQDLSLNLGVSDSTV